MNLSNNAIQPAVNSNSSYEADVPVTGRWLTILCPACVAIMALTLAIWIVAIPFRYAQLGTVCSKVCGDQQPSQNSIAQMQAAGITPDFYAAYVGTVEVLFVLAYMVIAVLIFWKRSHTRMGLLTPLFLVTFGVTMASAPNALAAAYPILQGPVGLLQSIGWLGLGLFLFLFPDGRFIPRWTRVTVVVGIAAILLSNAPFLPSWLNILLILGFVVLTLIVQIYRYRSVFTLAQQQQTKWVVFGTATAIVGFLGIVSLSQIFSWSQSPNGYGFLIGDTLIYLVQALIPISIGLAILRTKLWDIDIVINRTLVYGTLTVILALIYFGLVFGSQLLVGGLAGDAARSPLIIVGSTLVIAALFQPLRRRTQQLIDRRFYRHKYDAAHILSAFSATLRNEVDLNQLSDHLVTVVEETMQPAHVSLWLRKPEDKR
jgi:hypothetical protein